MALSWKISRSSGINLAALLALRVVLDISYINFIAPVFAYEGYTYAGFSERYLISWILYIFCALFSPSRINQVSDYFFATMTCSFVAPISSLAGLSGRALDPLIATILSYFLILIISSGREVKIPRLLLFKKGELFALLLSLILIFFVLLWYVLTGAIFNMNFDLSRVYDFRDVNEQLTDIGLMAYLNSWTYQVFSLFLLVYALWKKMWPLAVIAISVEFIFFGVSSHKSILFYPFLVLAIWAYFRDRRDLYIVPVLFSVIIIVCLLLFEYSSDLMTGSMFIRRVFYVPALLTYEYFDFFRGQSFVYWSNSILSAFIDYPYSQRLTLLIGEAMGTGASANNGYISSGYSHAGYFGILLYSIIIAVVLVSVNAFARRVGPLWVSLALLAIPYRTLILSSDLFTTLLTHGLLVTILLMVFVGGKSAQPNK